MLSMKNLGAGRCVGFDFSGGFIGQGKELAAAGGICCELVQADIYKLGHEYDGQFDIAYITSGTLCCLPDLDGFFAVVSRLMRAGAWMLMEEIHPIMDMFSVEPSRRLRWLRFEYSYFSSEPRRVRRGLDYYRKKAYAAESCYFFHHKLADVMQAILNNAMRIESFAEHDTDTRGGRFKRLMKRRSRLPLSYTITAVRC
jgi:ubiquinone/menaquinone biosynthesis C-methylase UbiE